MLETRILINGKYYDEVLADKLDVHKGCAFDDKPNVCFGLPPCVKKINGKQTDIIFQLSENQTHDIV